MANSKSTVGSSAGSPRAEGGRKPYRAPTLVVFGNVARLTGTKVGSGTDGTMQMSCL